MLPALRTWTDAVRARDINKILKLYDKRAFMIGAMDADQTSVRYGQDEINEYFIKLFMDPINEFGLSSYAAILLDDDRVLCIGYYGWVSSKPIRAKFSFLFHKVEGDWLIKSHVAGLCAGE